jgi:5-formyltetrahydrofolate cyclo-ligase
MPTPRIRNGFLLLDPAKIPRRYLIEASTISGAFRPRSEYRIKRSP